MVTLDDIQRAADRIRGVALRTPLLPFRDVFFFKAENLQSTGSFKIRGAYNTLAQLTDEQLRTGVVAHSSGNHGRAVARAARILHGRSVIVMPSNAPQVKIEGVEDEGGEIVFVGPDNEERVRRAHEIAHDDGLELVSSANDERVIAGQGTIGLEMLEQLAEHGDFGPWRPVVLVPVGLGGLAAGVATAVKALRPDAHVFGVEPELAADTHASLAAGKRTPWPPDKTARTIADGLRAESPAEIPFEHLRTTLDGVLLVSEKEIAAAVAVAARELRLVLEPSGAVSLAACLRYEEDLPSGARLAILSGGNVDPARYAEYLSAG
jgi:threonine dehydratase